MNICKTVGVFISSQPPVLTEQDVINAVTQAVQAHLDSTAQQHSYDGILSLCSYATSLDAVFKAEGQAGVEWRDACWRYCYQVMADVQNNLRAIPTPEGLIEELPVMVWPVTS